MEYSKRISLFFLAHFCNFERKGFPVSRLEKIYKKVSLLYQQEAVESYLHDKQDIGFFEIFILGADETKKFSEETNESIETLRRSDIKEKIFGYSPSSRRIREEHNDVVQRNIDSKKMKVVDILQSRDEIINYLGKRILTQDEALYDLLSNLYERIQKKIYSCKEKQDSKDS